MWRGREISRGIVSKKAELLRWDGILAGEYVTRVVEIGRVVRMLLSGGFIVSE